MNYIELLTKENLSLLSEKEQSIMKMRFGLYNRTYTLEEVGKIFLVTRERIRQIEIRAIEKIIGKNKKVGLSELILECGNNFGTLVKAADVVWFQAFGKDWKINPHQVGNGKSAEEAVANLLLKLKNDLTS